MSKNRSAINEATTDPLEGKARLAAKRVKHAATDKRIRGVSKTAGLKLPYEHDEMADTQPPPEPTEPMKQAVRDIERGVQDTDRGAVVGSTYSALKRK
jgi:hypothetical protein